VKPQTITVETTEYNMTRAVQMALEEAERVVSAADPETSNWAVGTWRLTFVRFWVRKYSWRDETLTYSYEFLVELK
jgi:hypothetical protein